MIERFDFRLISFIRAISLPFARTALFIVFFWFGALKVFYASPANALVEALLNETLPFITFDQFIFGFGVFEMAIGAAFLIPGLERLAIALLVPHMATTLLPLVVLPEVAWQAFLVPTLEGQYIIKNLMIIALALGIAARLEPFGNSKNP